MMKSKLDDLIDSVPVKNNSGWLNEEQVRYSIGESRLVITRKDVHDIISKLPIFINGVNNIHVQIIDGVVIVSPNEFKVL